ncbi:MAG: type II secretion system protein [Desulfovibrio sp.]|mgnify:CR=1 FL=1|nr:MAG: type II secretion system protein [Desulfovibrio sp.]
MRKTHSQSGLTILEVIVTVVIFGFVSSMLLALMGPQVIESHSSVYIARNSVLVEERMEQVTSRYIQLVNSNTPLSAITTLESEINNGNFTDANCQTTVLTDPVYASQDSDSDDLLLVQITSVADDGGHSLINLFTSSRTTSLPLEIY